MRGAKAQPPHSCECGYEITFEVFAMLSRWYLVPFSLLVVLAGSPGRAADPQAIQLVAVSVQPTELELRHYRQPNGLQVLGTTADGFTLDLRSQAQFSSADPRIAVVDDQGW